jgi:hypothetical protein
MSLPLYVRRFREVLLNSAVNRVDLDWGRIHVSGTRGILTTSHLQYNTESFQLLGRNLEYTFRLSPARSLELSLQLYLNVSDHWRLFAYCRRGMLLSVNLTLLQKGSQRFTVCQTLRLSTRGISTGERAQRTAGLCAVLRNMGYELDSNNRLILGTFDASAGRFTDVNPEQFLRSFLVCALVKGHFMGNKGYTLKALPQQPLISGGRNRTFAGRSIPLRLRYTMIEQANQKCCACGRGLQDGLKLHVDHITPVSQGGRTELANLQVLCSQCNLGKGNHSAKRFRRVRVPRAVSPGSRAT